MASEPLPTDVLVPSARNCEARPRPRDARRRGRVREAGAPDRRNGAAHEDTRLCGVNCVIRQRVGGYAREIGAIGDGCVEAKLVRRADGVDAGDDAFQRLVEMRIRGAKRFDLGNREHGGAEKR